MTSKKKKKHDDTDSNMEFQHDDSNTHRNELIDTDSIKPLNLADVINFFWRWRKVLMIACGLAALAAIVITMPFITKPKYQATHIFYPTKNNSISDGCYQMPVSDKRIHWNLVKKKRLKRPCKYCFRAI